MRAPGTPLALISLSAALCIAVGCAHEAAAPQSTAATAATATTPPVEKPTEPAAVAAPELVALPAPSHPMVAFRILFRAGSADDPHGQEGVTTLAAELMASGGTEKLTSAEQLRALYPMAGQINAQTDKEMTVFTGRVHKDHLAHFLPLLLDVVTHPRWDPQEFERVRTDMVNDIERHLRTSDDENLGKEALASMLYAGHPYGHYAGGAASALKSLTLDQVRAQAARVFTRSRLMIGIAGGYDDATVAALQQGLAALPQGTDGHAVVPAAPPQVGPRALIVEKEAGSTAISLGYPWMMRRGHPDYPALFLAMSAFGEHRQFNGRLMHDLRGVRGLNYGDYAYVEHFSQDGWGNFASPNVGRSVQDFTIWIRPVENPNRVFALRAALWEAKRLATGGLTDEEVARAKKFLAGYTFLFTQTDSRRLGYAMDERYYATPGFLDALRARIATLTTDEVNAAIRKWIHPDELRYAVVTKDGAAMARALLDNAASAIHYDSPKPPEVLAEDKEIEKLPFGLTEKDVRVAPASALFER